MCVYMRACDDDKYGERHRLTHTHTLCEQPQVLIKAEENANKRDRLFKRETSCPRPQAGNGANFVYASGQSLLNGRLAIATAATPLTSVTSHEGTNMSQRSAYLHLVGSQVVQVIPSSATSCTHSDLPIYILYSDPKLHKIFYFTATASGECYCAEAAAPEVVRDPSATERALCFVVWSPRLYGSIPQDMHTLIIDPHVYTQHNRRMKRPYLLMQLRPRPGCASMCACA